jgi:pyruvate dehydrogenase phosphatase
MIKVSLTSAVSGANTVPNSTIEGILVQCISSLDDRITAELVSFFPRGPNQIFGLTDEEIKSTIRDPNTGNSCVQIMRARTGTTVLIALIDPRKSIHVASLGDSDAGKHARYPSCHVLSTS